MAYLLNTLDFGGFPGKSAITALTLAAFPIQIAQFSTDLVFEPSARLSFYTYLGEIP